MAQQTFTVPSTSVYVDSVTGGRHQFKKDEVIPLDQAIRFSMPGAAAAAGVTPFPAGQDAWLETRITAAQSFATAAVAVVTAAGSNGLHNPAAVTATADGLTTGIVSDVTDFVTVTSSVNTNLVTLPTPTPGRRISLRNGGTGYKLRSSTPGSVAINGGTGASASTSIGANVLVECKCDTAATWICTSFAAAGTVTATTPAA